jgi:LysR family transcriptional regulator, low CO2-responsive transcriptional regulator
MPGMRNLSLKQLQAVSAIARSGSLTKAADVLAVTPAALTARIKQLEEEVGLPLFDRTSAGLRPTDAGREILHAFDAINGAIDACADRLNAMKGLSGGRITVGVVSTAKYFAPQAIAAFSQLHPAVEINLLVGNRGQTVQALKDYDVDLAIMGRPPGDFPVEAVPFGEHPFVIVAHPNHPLAIRKGLMKADLAREAFLVREDGSGTQAVFEEFMGGIAVRRPRLGIEMGSNETIKQAVMAGLGVALISGHTVAMELEAGRLALLDVAGLPIRRQWYALRRADRTLGPAARAFRQFLVDEGAKLLPRLPSKTRGWQVSARRG